MSEPVYIPGQDMFGPSMDMDIPPYPLGRSYREEDERAIKWMNGQDVLDPFVRSTDYLRDKEKAIGGPKSPSSSVYKAVLAPTKENASTVSSWQRKSPSSMQYRPDFPPSSALVWDLLEAQDIMLKPYQEPKPHPDGFRTNWPLISTLEDLTPPLLLGERMVCDSITDAEAIYDCLTRNYVVKQNRVQKTPTAKQLEEMLERTPVRLSEPKLKQLEWVIGLVFDLRVFNRDQFQEIHDGKELVYAPLWDSYFACPRGGIGSFFGWGYPSGGKARSRSKIYNERLDYWDDERRWQNDVWGPDYFAQNPPTPTRAPSPTDGLAAPSESQLPQMTASLAPPREPGEPQSAKASLAQSPKT